MKLKMGENAILANKIYDEKLKSRLEPDHLGEVIAIHVETGDYFLGRTVLEACRRGREKHPDAVFVCRRVGKDAPVYRIGTL